MRHEKYIFEKDYKGSVYFTVRFNYGQNETYCKSFKASDYPTKNAALNAAVADRDLQLAKKLTGKLASKESYTLDEMMKQKQALLSRSIVTNEKHQCVYEKYLKPYRSRQLASITTADIQKSVNGMVDIASQGTIKKVMVIWRSLYKTAAKLELNIPDKTINVDVPRSHYLEDHHPKRTSIEDVRTMCSALMSSAKIEESKYNHQLICYALLIMYYVGLRPAEVFSIRREDINYDTHELAVRRSIASNSVKKNVITRTKTPESESIVVLCDPAEDALRGAESMSANDYIFMEYNGNMFKINSVDAVIRITSRKIGVPFTMYCCRHQFSTNLMLAGVDPRTIQEMMRHKEMQMSVEYARSDKTHKLEALKNIK